MDVALTYIPVGGLSLLTGFAIFRDLVPVRASPVPSVVRGSFVVKFSFWSSETRSIYLNKRTLSHSTQARHRCELARASTITGKKNFTTTLSHDTGLVSSPSQSAVRGALVVKFFCKILQT